MKPIRCAPAWAVVDTDGEVCWGLVFTIKRLASECASHPKRRVVRIKVAGVVRKSPRKARKSRRG